MKKDYIKPELNIENITIDDIICVSGGFGTTLDAHETTENFTFE